MGLKDISQYKGTYNSNKSLLQKRGTFFGGRAVLTELKESIKDIFSNKFRWLVVVSMASTVLIFIVLLAGFSFALSFADSPDAGIVVKTVKILGYLAFFVMSLMLFPAVATLVSGFFVDSVVEKAAKNGGEATLRAVPLSESLTLAGIGAVKGAGVSLALIPVSLLAGPVPVVNLAPAALYYALNGRLLAREYFYAVALRYMDGKRADALFDRFAPYWTRAGVLIAVLMTVPVVNTVSPLVAVDFMRRLFLKKMRETAE